MVVCGDKRWDKGNSFTLRNRPQLGIALRASARRVRGHTDSDLQVAFELAQLRAEIVACDQRRTVADGFAFDQVPVPGQQPAILAQRAFEQPFVGCGLLIDGVVAQQAQPPRQPSEHNVGDKGLGRCHADRLLHRRGREPDEIRSESLSELLGEQ